MSSNARTSLNALAFSATVHCLTGCAIGEVVGMIIGTALDWSNLATMHRNKELNALLQERCEDVFTPIFKRLGIYTT